MISGCHLIAGQWVATDATYTPVEPATGAALEPQVCEADAAIVDRAAHAAEHAFEVFAATEPQERADLLRKIADEIELRGQHLTARAHRETALPTVRLDGERGRTTGQLRFFADWIEQGVCFDGRIDTAMPGRAPLPRSDIRSILRPIGPVAVFGASNFPLAFSVAGGDTASALAAGCPVIVKGHPAHPGTSELVGDAIRTAIDACGLPAGVFGLIQGSDHTGGVALVEHPLIQAVGFTGSLRGGRALFDIACRRAQPIPFFGELGSINPVFALPGALAARGGDLAQGWVQSLTMGVGQFCTNPGVVVGLEGADFDTFLSEAETALGAVRAQIMLTEGIARGFRERVGAHGARAAVRVRSSGEGMSDGCAVSPAVFEVSAADWLANPDLHEEMFGPGAIAVRCRDVEEMRAVAVALEGQLTATIQMEDADVTTARALVPILERKAGRLLCNGFPTGVEVCHAMMHGGPYPASTDTRTTSVGSRAIGRFLRPVAYQDFADALLPSALRDDTGAPVMVDGVTRSGR